MALFTIKTTHYRYSTAEKTHEKLSEKEGVAKCGESPILYQMKVADEGPSSKGHLTPTSRYLWFDLITFQNPPF